MLKKNTLFAKPFRSILSAIAFVGIASISHADTMPFNFNSLTDGANNAAIQTYMQSILTAATGGTVAVSGAIAERNYDGDDHVVGGTFSNGNHNYTWSNTLGTSDGATGPLNAQRNPYQANYYDTFIVNNNFSSPKSDKITMSFSLPLGFQIDSVSFDYEIFPNAQCRGGQGTTNCSVVPDFTFKADGIQKLATLATKPVGGNPDGNNSPGSNSETAWQFIGVSGSGPININDTDNLTVLEFIDWPAEIGIDNLVINYRRPPDRLPPQSIPEPTSLLLLGFGLVGLRKYDSYHRRKHAA